jgi:hypothetical protein
MRLPSVSSHARVFGSSLTLGMTGFYNESRAAGEVRNRVPINRDEFTEGNLKSNCILAQKGIHLICIIPDILKK